MKKNNFRFRKYVICIIIIIFILLIVAYNKRNEINLKNLIGEKLEEKPIFENGEINNEYFRIYDNYENPRETLEGINNAIEYAAKNNIKYIKLKEGKYLIDGTSDETYLSEGIKIEVSNITFDLNGSTIKYIDNDKPSYNIIRLIDVENVVIKNGILVGDRLKHNYNAGEISHAFGCGVSINASKNVEIANLKIYNMIGDGIYIGNTWDKDFNKYKESSNCKIINNHIYDCRRLGIAVTGGENISIESNEIYSIDGVWPKAGIDLEANENEKLNNIYIQNNKIYNLGSGYSVIVSKNTRDVWIENNEFSGGIQGLDGKTEINIRENIIERKYIF